MNERDTYIDTLRGIAALSVVAIHTAFWSGQSYTPQWFGNLTLFIDVPFFFYLSGWGSSFKKEIDIIRVGRSILKIWFRWIFFVCMLGGFCYFSKFMPIKFAGVTSFRELIRNFFFDVTFSGFCVVGGSIWFMPWYFLVILGNSLILSIINAKDRRSEYQKFYFGSLVAVFLWVSFGQPFFGFDVRFYVFYSMFWMFGYLRRGNATRLKELLVRLGLCIVSIMLTSNILCLPLYDIQSAKFPPTIKYLAVSMPVIFVSNYIRKYRKNENKILMHIGKNAIFYFFGQGVGSSLLFLLSDKNIFDFWFCKWMVLYCINILITIVVAEIIAKLYGITEKLICSVIEKYFRQC